MIPRLRLFAILIVAIPLLTSAPVIAQTVTTLQFAPSADHSVTSQGANIVDRYELVVTPQTGAAPAPLNLAKPTPVNNVISVPISNYINTLPPGTYTAVVKAIGPGGEGVSAPSAPFGLTIPQPRAPAGSPTITRSSGQ